LFDQLGRFEDSEKVKMTVIPELGEKQGGPTDPFSFGR
jgi:hypothetical protein